MHKNDAATYIRAHLTRVASWRRSQHLKYPDDHRNQLAASLLDEMAADTTPLGDALWAGLQPLCLRGRLQYQVDEMARDIGFRSNAETLPEFIDQLIRRFPNLIAA